MTDKRYPLHWPAGWPRTMPQHRRTAAFGQQGGNGWKQSVSMTRAFQRLQREIELLNASGIVLSTNTEIRLDGQPYSNRRTPDDCGAAVYFTLKGKPVSLACDKWNRVEDNIVALSKHIEALRGMDRWGVGSVEQAFRGYEALPAPEQWWQVLGLGEHATREEIQAARRRLAAGAHPDRNGGAGGDMARINAAADQGIARLTSR